MKLIIDTDNKTLTIEESKNTSNLNLYSDEAFAILSSHWLKVGWNQKYTYTFSWLGRPVIQLPEDLIRLQEAIYDLKPDVIIETGVAHGGSLIYYATLCHVMGKGRIIGIDIEIRPHNRTAIENHTLARYVTLIEGSSTDDAVIRQVRALITKHESVMVILDSNHSREHVAEELRAYAGFVTPGSFIVVTDGIMRDLADVPRGHPSWTSENPAQAAVEFLSEHPEFAHQPPAWLFNESGLQENLTYFPIGWLKKLR